MDIWVLPLEGERAPEPLIQTPFTENRPAMTGVPIATEDGFAPGAPEVLFEGPYLPDVFGRDRTYDLAPDGQRFLMIKPGTGSDSSPSEITVVLNWYEELLERVPVP